MTHIVSLNIFKSAFDRYKGTFIKKSQILNTFEMCGKSLVLISDNFLLFILLLIFLHSSEHGTHALADLFKLTSDIIFFNFQCYFQPAAVITSKASACFAP